MQPRAPITTDLVLLGRGARACRGAAPVRHAPRARPARHHHLARAAHALFGNAARIDTWRVRLRRGAYRPRPARRRIGRAAHHGGGDRARPGEPRRSRSPAGRTSRSICYPSTSAASPPCRRSGGVPVKPIGRFLDRLAADRGRSRRRRAHRHRRRRPGGDRTRPGAGAPLPAGASACTWCAARPSRFPRHPPRARAAARAALVEAGVELACGVQAGPFAAGTLSLSDGCFLRADEVLWATGVVGTRLPRRIRPRLRRRRLRRVSGAACAAPAIASCSPPETAPASRGRRDQRPGCGRCAPGRRSPPIYAAPRAAGRCAAGIRSAGARDPRPRRRPRIAWRNGVAV